MPIVQEEEEAKDEEEVKQEEEAKDEEEVKQEEEVLKEEEEEWWTAPPHKALTHVLVEAELSVVLCLTFGLATTNFS